MQSFKDSMKWDEDVFGLGHDLDVYNLIAVGDIQHGRYVELLSLASVTDTEKYVSVTASVKKPLR